MLYFSKSPSMITIRYKITQDILFLEKAEQTLKLLETKHTW